MNQPIGAVHEDHNTMRDRDGGVMVHYALGSLWKPSLGIKWRTVELDLKNDCHL